MKSVCKVALVVSILFFVSRALGQEEISIVSHYPASAYVVKRLLPFALSGDDGAQVNQVTITNTGHCSSLVDPFYENTFHIYCRQPVVVDAQVWVTSSEGELEVIPLDNLSVANQRAPNDGFDSAIRTSSLEGEGE